MTASLILVKTGRDALDVQKRGIFDLPIAYGGMAMFALPTVFGMLWLIRVAGACRARVIAILLTGFHESSQTYGTPRI